MSRLFGFALGVAVALGGIYWLLRQPEPPGQPAALATTFEPSRPPNALLNPEALRSAQLATPPTEWDQSEDKREAIEPGEVVSVTREVLAQTTAAIPAGEEPSLGGDAEPADTIPHQAATGLGSEPSGEVAAAEAADLLPQAPAPAVPAAQSQGEISPWQESGAAPVADAAPRDSLRFVFWSPFRSERAAQGFADRLSLTTAIPMEVLRLEAGHYRVAFDYRDEAERLAFIERIEKITGLDLSGDGPR